MILYLKRIINIKKENSREHSKSNNNDKDSKNNKKLSKKQLRLSIKYKNKCRNNY